jgi:glycosyltransferase involved in cell wall biosynthesis
MADQPGMHLPTVAVVIPSHRRTTELERALRGVLEQTYPGNLEAIVVFDRSPVRMPAVGSLPANRTLRSLANTRAPGLAGARNTGLLSTDAPLVAFCDDDDHWFETKLEQQVAALSKSPAALASSCGVVFAHGRRRRARVAPSNTVTYTELLRRRRPDVHSSTLVFRRVPLLSRVGVVDEGIPTGYGEDYDLLLRIAQLEPIVVVREPLVEVSVGRSHFAGRWDGLVAGCLYLLQKHPDLRRDRRGLARIAGQIAFAYAALGRPRDSAAWAWRCLTLSPGQPRSYLALLVTSRALRAETVVRLARYAGRGI